MNYVFGDDVLDRLVVDVFFVLCGDDYGFNSGYFFCSVFDRDLVLVVWAELVYEIFFTDLC